MRTPITLAFLAMAALATPALAQTDSETTTDEAETAATDLSMGEEALQVGQPYIAAESGDWALRCLKAEEGSSDPCQLYQLLRDEDGNSVAEISMFPLADGGEAAAGATIVVPLETLLTEQVTISVDGSNARRIPFTFCNGAGCVSRVGFSDEHVNQFKRGNQATLRIVPAAAPDQPVLLTISLTGFTVGFDGLEVN